MVSVSSRTTPAAKATTATAPRRRGPADGRGRAGGAPPQPGRRRRGRAAPAARSGGRTATCARRRAAPGAPPSRRRRATPSATQRCRAGRAAVTAMPEGHEGGDGDDDGEHPSDRQGRRRALRAGMAEEQRPRGQLPRAGMRRRDRHGDEQRTPPGRIDDPGEQPPPGQDAAAGQHGRGVHGGEPRPRGRSTPATRCRGGPRTGEYHAPSRRPVTRATRWMPVSAPATAIATGMTSVGRWVAVSRAWPAPVCRLRCESPEPRGGNASRATRILPDRPGRGGRFPSAMTGGCGRRTTTVERSCQRGTG